MTSFRMICLAGLLAICIGGGGICADKDKISSLFYKANSYYEEEKYAQAIDQYSQILDKGYESGNIYYNMGNCYYKLGRLAYAVLYYEKARRFIPRDMDLSSNLNYVRSRIVKSYQTPVPGVFKRIILATFSKLNINEKAVFIFIFNSSIFIILISRLLFDRFRKYYLYLLFFLCIIWFFSIYSLIEDAVNIDKLAVVISKESSVNFEPIDTATTHFNIYGGEKVKVISREKDWYKVKRLDGKTGWIKKGSIQVI